MAKERKIERKKERIKTICDFATRRFRTLTVPFTHFKGLTTFFIDQIQQVNLQKD